MTRERAQRKQSKKRTRSVWMAAGTLMAYSAVRPAAHALAATTPEAVTAGGAGAMAALPVRRFEIPAGPLGAVLEAYLAASGVKVRVPDTALFQLPSGGVTGVLSVEVALRQILAGTGLGFRFTSSDTAELTLDAHEAMEVMGKAPVDISPKFTEPILDTPQTISVVPREVMEQQGATTLRDALRNVAGISIAAGEGGAQGDNLTIRGFSARNDLFIDGMRDFGSYYRDPFNMKRSKCCKGPSSVIFGRGSTGGVVNQANKTPHLQPLPRRRVSDSVRTEHPPRHPGPQRAAARLAEGAAFNLIGHGQRRRRRRPRHRARIRRFGVAPSLGFGLGTPDPPDALLLAPDRRRHSGLRHSLALQRPAPVDTVQLLRVRGRQLPSHECRHWARSRRARFQQRRSVRNQTRYAHYAREGASGSADRRPRLRRRRRSPRSWSIAIRSPWTAWRLSSPNQLDVTANFETGSPSLARQRRRESAVRRPTPRASRYTGVPTTSLLAPGPVPSRSRDPPPSSQVDAPRDQRRRVCARHRRPRPKWSLVSGGFRWDRFETRLQADRRPGGELSAGSTTCPPGGRPSCTSRCRPAASTSTRAPRSIPPPNPCRLRAANAASREEPVTYELGTKWDLSGRLSLGAPRSSSTDKTNAREPDPNNPSLNVLAGTQRVEGVEVEVTGHVPPGGSSNLSLRHPATRARRIRSYYPAVVGARLANVPGNTLHLWNTVSLPWRCELGAGELRQQPDREHDASLRSDHRSGQAGARLLAVRRHGPSGRFRPRIDLQLNVYNLANRTTTTSSIPGHIVPGAGPLGADRPHVEFWFERRAQLHAAVRFPTC